MPFRIRCIAVLALAACSSPESAATVSGGPAMCAVARQPAGAPDSLLALIEIARGGQAKYEYNADLGRLQVSRFLPDSVRYPVAYGAFPCTLAGDRDPLDLLLLSNADVLPGVLVPVRPIGVLRMLDRGAQDDKIIVVPLADGLRTVTAVEESVITRFFRTYKGPDADLVVGPWLDADSARTIIAAAIAAAR
jgi:inorganic pyrophosphatase